MKRTLSYIAIIIGLSCVILVAMGLWYLKGENLKSRDGQPHLIYIYPNTTQEQLIKQLQEYYDFSSLHFFKWHCRLLRFQAPKAGCYSIGQAEADMALIYRLRNREQTPVNITFNNIRTPQQLAARLSQQLMLDSLQIIQYLQDENLMSQYGLNAATAVSLFIPNTYEVYWNISTDGLFQRMYKEYRHFWNEHRTAQAKRLGLTPAEIATVASIIEEESNRQEDYPIIAGLYLNRLKKGMPLQACPTVKYALQDFGLRRILTKHLQVESPYNTYKYAGLPPGPIRIPRAATMDAVLNSKKHNYLYMCASTAFDGTHHFSSTYAEHARYARHYQAELNKRKIK